MSQLKTIRELASAYQAFESYSSRHIRGLGLSPSQFDIVATLGNTPGMSCSELGEKTLITKGTLTGVLDRLADKQLIERCEHETDGRSTLVRLTDQGQQLFETVFPAHLKHLDKALKNLSTQSQRQLQQLLIEFREMLQEACHE